MDDPDLGIIAQSLGRTMEHLADVLTDSDIRTNEELLISTCHFITRVGREFETLNTKLKDVQNKLQGKAATLEELEKMLEAEKLAKDGLEAELQFQTSTNKIRAKALRDQLESQTHTNNCLRKDITEYKHAIYEKEQEIADREEEVEHYKMANETLCERVESLERQLLAQNDAQPDGSDNGQMAFTEVISAAETSSQAFLNALKTVAQGMTTELRSLATSVDNKVDCLSKRVGDLEGGMDMVDCLSDRIGDLEGGMDIVDRLSDRVWDLEGGMDTVGDDVNVAFIKLKRHRDDINEARAEVRDMKRLRQE